MLINVHVKDKQFKIECGEGKQKLKWLGDVAIFRYSHFYSKLQGTTQGIKMESGEQLNLQQKVFHCCEEGQHLWVIIQDEYLDNDNISMFESQQNQNIKNFKIKTMTQSQLQKF